MKRCLAVAVTIALNLLGPPFASAQNDVATSATSIDPKADQWITRLSETLRNAQTAKVDISVDFKMKAQGMSNEMSAQFHLAIQKPNKFALVSEPGNIMAVTAVSDGTSLTVYQGHSNSYYVLEAPKDIESASSELSSAIMGNMAGMLLLPFLSSNPKTVIMDGVTSGIYVGTETRFKSTWHRLRFHQEEFDWDILVSDDKEALPLEVVPDVSRVMQQYTGQLGGKMEMQYTITFKNWELNKPVPVESFQFKPPQGAKLEQPGSDAEEEEPSELLGKPAPDFKLPLLNGAEVSLSQLRGKVVVLDFWATWCGPCRKGLPILAEVAKDFANKNVAVYAVNQSEETSSVEKFVRDTSLTLTVAMDKEGSVGEQYGADAIPTSVIIDSGGVVQAVHRGLSRDYKAQLTKEIEAVLSGKNLSDEKLKASTRSATGTASTDMETSGLPRLWSSSGKWSAVATYKTRIFAVTTRGNAAEFKPADGSRSGDMTLSGSISALRCANLAGDDAPEFLGFKAWGSSVIAFDNSGSQLWEHPGGQGIDDVWPADLNSDKLHEVIIGYNGGTGLHALDNTGKPLWSNTKLGNVWNVAAGHIESVDAMTVFTTSASGQVHLFDAEGTKVRDLRPKSMYCTEVRAAPGAGASGLDLVIVGGSNQADKTDKSVRVVAMDAKGTEKWSVSLPSKQSHIDEMDCSADGKYTAIACRGESVYVLAVSDGHTIGSNKPGSAMVQLAWSAGPDGQPILLIATGKDLVAYGVKQ